jgi:hypothetical protein
MFRSNKHLSSDNAPDLGVLENNTRRKVLQLLNKEGEELVNKQEQEESRGRCYIDPLSGFVMGWDLAFLALFYCLQMQISLSLAFGPGFFEEELGLDSVYLPVYLCMLSLLVVDCLLSFCKGYYAFGKGKVVDDKHLIIRHYLTSQFPLDFLTIALYIVPLIHQSLDLNFLQLMPAALIWVKKFDYQREV